LLKVIQYRVRYMMRRFIGLRGWCAEIIQAPETVSKRRLCSVSCNTRALTRACLRRCAPISQNHRFIRISMRRMSGTI
jgi:hypothetical protein